MLEAVQINAIQDPGDEKPEDNIEDRIKELAEDSKEWFMYMNRKTHSLKDMEKTWNKLNKEAIYKYYRDHRKFGIFSGVATAFALMRGYDYSDIQDKIVKDVEARIKVEERQLDKYRNRLYTLQDKLSLYKIDMVKLHDKLEEHKKFVDSSSKQLQELESVIDYKVNKKGEQPKLEHLSHEVLNYSLEKLFDEKAELTSLLSRGRTEEQKIRNKIIMIGKTLRDLKTAIATWRDIVRKKEEELYKTYQTYGLML